MTLDPNASSTIQHWERLWQTPAATRTYSAGPRILRELLADGPVRGLLSLEVGGGSARDTLGLAREGARTVVLDFAPTALELVRRKAAEQGVTVHLVRADAFHMPFREGTFDLVFHQGLLEHFVDGAPLLAENARVTRRGGRVVVDVPQTFHPYTLAKHALMAAGRWYAGWERQFTPAELEGCVTGVGLVVHRTYGEWMVPALWYRLMRNGLAAVLRIQLPFEPRGPRWWESGWRALRAHAARHRVALYTCHCIGVIAQRP
jgi:SAM-dependent methyltransferase